MELYISSFAAGVSLAALVFSIIVYAKSLRRQRKQATLDAYHTLQADALDKLNEYTKKQVAEIAQDPRSAEYKKLSALLARCEHFAVGVKENVYDAAMLRELADTYFAIVFDKLKPLIDAKRKNGRVERYYQALESLATSTRRD